ncbi:solute carrier family 2, facilitated glucose transporter member 5-like [Anolis sagrei]|uniref:solute carrier family 2, facilitated glucose transporter member 5-like n=1 Tax=Anolis sagrei TaxID=38937 RepID=UPI003521AB61
MEIKQRRGTLALSKDKKVTATLLWATIVASLGILQHGYSLWVIYSPSVQIRTFNYLEDEEETAKGNEVTPSFLLMVALSMSVFPLGGTTGSLMFGPLVDRSGRKGTLLITSFISVIASLIMVSANTLQSFGLVMFAHFTIGITIGIYTSAAPLYVAEISPLNSRGAIGLIPHLFLILGMAVAQILSFEELLGTYEGWAVMMSLCGVPALVQCLLLPSFPESPRYLLIQRMDEEQARQALKNLRGPCDVEDEIEELHQEDISEKAEKDMNALKLLTYRELRWHVITIIVLMVFQQLAGNNWVYHFARVVYHTIGMAPKIERYITLGSAGVMMGTIVLTMTAVDSVGRRVLFLISVGATTVLSLTLSITLNIQGTNKWIPYANGVLLNIYLNAQVLGPASLRYLLMAELFRQSSRSSAYVVGGFTHWIIHLFTILIYVQIKDYIGAFTFTFSFFISLVTFVFIYKVVPETKTRTFLDIYRLSSVDNKAEFCV